MSSIQFYLASSSPRRAQILQNLGFRFEIFCSEIDESPQINESAQDYVLRMAIAKNQAARLRWQQEKQRENTPHLDSYIPFLSADTSVILDNQILGKPKDPAHAAQMLQSLSGREHQVITALCVANAQQIQSAVQISQVYFKNLSEQEISRYIATGEPMDKAGAYGIQQLGGAFIQHISGSFTGVMGLPVFESVELLKAFGVELF